MVLEHDDMQTVETVTANPKKKRAWLKYVHWFGYLSSLIVILQLIFLSYLVITQYIDSERARAYTMMHSGPASARLSADGYDREQAALLDKLPSISKLKPDGLRVVALPSFGDTHFAISLQRTRNGAEGVLIMIPQDTNLAQKSFQIALSSAAYLKLTSELDALSSSWEGENNRWTDGTGIVFERIKNDEVTSGLGNSPNFYGKIGTAVFDALRPSIPELSRYESDGHPKGTFDQ